MWEVGMELCFVFCKLPTDMIVLHWYAHNNLVIDVFNEECGHKNVPHAQITRHFSRAKEM